MAKQQTPADPWATAPVWAREIRARFISGQAHAFILTGNVDDYVQGNTTLARYLAAMFSNRVVVTYDMAGGFGFPYDVGGSQQHQQLFIERSGYTPPGQQAAANPAMAALQRAQGQLQQPAPRGLPRMAPSQAVGLLETFLKWCPTDGWRDESGQLVAPQACVVITNMEALAPNTAWAQIPMQDREIYLRLAEWGRAIDDFACSQAIVLGVCRALSDLHETIRSSAARWAVIDLPMPDQADRQEYWQLMAARAQDLGQQLLADGLDVGAMARLSAGLRRIDIEDLLLQAQTFGQPITLASMRQKKAQIASQEYSGAIELADPRGGFETVGGKDRMKAWFIRNVVRPLREGNVRRTPMGVLMVGPAGTGKTIFAKAAAFEAGVNFMIFNPANIYDSLYGATERNLEKVIKLTEGVAPCIVFIDEIDQAMARGAANDPVGQRVFRRMLEWMADTSHRGKVVIMAASNRPDLIDAAMLRPGRFDKIVPFLAPDLEERAAVLRVQVAQADITAQLSDQDYAQVAALTEGWTGAELESLVGKAKELCEDAAPNQAVLTLDWLLQAQQYVVPNTQDIEFMTDLALQVVSDLDLLPADVRQRAANKQGLAQRVKDYRETFEPAQPVQRGPREL